MIEQIVKMMNGNIIICPKCNQPLSAFDHNTICPNCGFSFEQQNGILDFMPGNDFYWGEITQEKMRKINEQAMRDGNWFKVVSEQLAERPDLIQYFTDLGRLGWLFHSYQCDQNDVCVDIGSGLGSLSFNLSRFYKEVYSIDGVLDRLKFQVIRAKEENINNIRFIRTPLLKLPFQDESVDLVVVNGVLEWIGLSDFSKKPEELQMIFLKEINRILKPNGIMYLGIENRFGAQYFTGRKDHSGIPYTSLLPRKVASWLMYYLHAKDQKDRHYYFEGLEKGYRTYTYSIWGYEKLLKAAGLKYIKSNWTLPSYSIPRYSGPLDGDSIKYTLSYFSDRFKKRWMKAALKLFLRLPRGITKFIHKIFVPDFLIIASKTPLSKTLPDYLHETYPNMKSFTRMNMGFSPALNTTFHITNEKVKVTETVRFKEEKKPELTQSVITIQNNEVLDGRPFKAEKQEDVEKAAEWLASFQKSTTSGFWTEDDLHAEIAGLIKNARKLFKGVINDDLAKYENVYRQYLMGIQIPIVTEHGDFSPQNILIESNDAVTVVDWDQMLENGNPMMDVGSFAFSILKAKGKRSIFEDAHSNKSLKWFQERYLREQRLPFNLTPAYYLLRVVAKFIRSPGGSSEQIYIQNYWLNFLRRSLNYAHSGKAFEPVNMNDPLVVSGSNP